MLTDRMKQVCALAVTLLVSNVLSSQPVPDFSHREHPHVMAKNAFALPSQLDQFAHVTHKMGSQPLMMILLEFPDSIHGQPPSHFESLLFGPDPSVNGYFEEISYGKFRFENAGVFGWFMAPQTSEFYFTGGNYTALASATVEAALNAGVEFESYDVNEDGEITRDELIIQMVFASHPPLNLPWVWATRPVQTQSDGVIASSGLEIDTWAVRGEEFGGIYLFAHELSHAALALPDLYGDDFGGDPSGYFTLMSSLSCVPAEVHASHISPWSKIHLGWIDPVVVTESGLYAVPNVEVNPVAYVLYDPSYGTDEYFIVENRWPAASVYENGLPDQGLAVWHITEFYDNQPFDFLKGRKMIAMKWAGGDGALTTSPPSALWNCAEQATCYDLTSNSRPRNSRWEGGAESGIGISEISEAGETMQAYFSFDLIFTNDFEMTIGRS